MWTIVRSKQQPSRRRRAASSSCSTSSATPVPAQVSVSGKSVTSEIRALRKAAQALRRLPFVREDVVLPLRRFIGSHSESLMGIEIVALGIGPFLRNESRTGFLQMALLLVVQSECELLARKLAKTRLETSDEEHCRGSTSQSAGVKTIFFDPTAIEVHKKCCANLGIVVEEHNLYGAYTPSGPHVLLIAYLPHIPWILLRNLFVSNLKHSGVATWGGPACSHELEDLPLRRTLVIGNDLNERLCMSSGLLEKMIPFLKFDKLHVCGGNRHASRRSSGSNNDTFEGDDIEEGLMGGSSLGDLGGISKYDVRHAFSDIAVMQLNKECEPLLTSELRRMQIPPIAREGTDVV
uniref:Uncharacterized protein TCIL3000_11_15440 n=1 Tax=Trypanosoma congolense (strain IL3000) TaxID=1068625 RepID=G0V304_TRYCI|nr:unnamed protein product [Trypanosoma congolense IL3000]